MFKKPLFWIIVVIAATVLWFIFAGHNKNNLPSIVPARHVATQNTEITGIPGDTSQASTEQARDNNTAATGHSEATQDDADASANQGDDDANASTNQGDEDADASASQSDEDANASANQGDEDANSNTSTPSS